MENENRLALFQASIEKMIATGEDSYRDRYGRRNRDFLRTRQYTKADIEEIILNGDIDSRRELSLSYYHLSGQYRRFILHYAYLPNYSYVIVPHYKKKISTQMKTNYYNVLDYLENLNIKTLCQHFATKVLVDGCYYGLLVRKDNQTSVMDLPFSYCRTRFKGFSGLDIVEINLQYFSSLTEDMRESALKVYPKEVSKQYRLFRAGKAAQWYRFDEGLGVYFCMDSEVPLFLNTIAAIEDLQEYRNLELTKQLQETKKILVQELGANKDGQFIIEPDEAVELHSGAVNMLSKNLDMDVLTTYAEVKVESLSDGRQTVTSSLNTFSDFVYGESGISMNNFNTTGNLSLVHSLRNDLSIMMSLADKFSRYFTYIVNEFVAINNVKYSFSILPVAFFNEKEYVGDAYKLATAGYSFLLPAIASGLTQRQAVDIKTLENTLLDLPSMFIPLQLSSTQSGAANEGGAPQKEDGEKADKTIRNLDGGGE